MPSPNIWHHRNIYELENRAVDPEQKIESAMRAIEDWTDRDVLDLGCGAGFHLPRLAADAGTVTGVEPHLALATVARRRISSLANTEVHAGTAQRLPLPDASIDMVHARWAYFFGPGCEPGLRELGRVMRRGGTAFVVDNEPTRSTFGSWFQNGYPRVDPDAVERFWSLHEWSRERLDIVWRFSSRADLEAVVRIEFDPSTATRFSPDTKASKWTTRSTCGGAATNERPATTRRIRPSTESGRCRCAVPCISAPPSRSIGDVQAGRIA